VGTFFNFTKNSFFVAFSLLGIKPRALCMLARQVLYHWHAHIPALKTLFCQLLFTNERHSWSLILSLYNHFHIVLKTLWSMFCC
jgi:hypothetical protein